MCPIIDAFSSSATHSFLTSDKNRRIKLTVNHLENAVLALDVREHVAHLYVLSFRGIVGLALLGFVDAALWVNVVAPGIVGVDRASGAVVRSTSKGVLVEALLGGHAVGVVEVGGVADEELAVTLRMCVVANVWVGSSWRACYANFSLKITFVYTRVLFGVHLRSCMDLFELFNFLPTFCT